MKRSVAARFWAKVDKQGPRFGNRGRCWLWAAGLLVRGGYGQFWDGTRMVRAHRFAYGNVPDGLHVLHHCDNPPCVRRSHLFLGVQSDNILDMVAKGRHGRYNARKLFCEHGHPLSGDNLYIRTNGSRRCRKCNSERQRRYRHERLAA